VQGHCYTGALELALACDLLVAGETARFADTHGKWSMTPTWGMSQRLPRRIGLLNAKELMFTGTPIDGARAVEIGLANRCVPDAELESNVRELAATIVANSWHTLRADKRLVNEGQRYTLAEGLDFERRTSPGAGPDMAERLKAFGAKS
jgi:enoyl-CoA hydratase/carnithine racemase